MEMARFVQGLEADLAAVAAVGDEQTAAAAERLIQAIRGSAGLRLLDVLGEAALEISGQLPAGHVEVRVSGQDPSLVYVGEPEGEPEPAAAEDGLTARITLRLPEQLKTQVEAAAAREGISVNSWLVRALGRSLAPRAVQRSSNRLQGFARG
jgi:HicB-like protein involved in pilus formation